MNSPLHQKAVKAVIVGAGNRSLLYASYAHKHPEELEIVGVVEPDSVRRGHAAELFQLDDSQLFASIEAFAATPSDAVAAINGTMDSLHVETSLPLLALGLDLLLEKPIGVSESEVLTLLEAARKHNRKVMICHVLRYAPYYREIRNRIANGDIGEILHIQTEENVSYHHMATAFVRGKWGNQAQGGSSMLMAKCCHDLDLLAWMKGGVPPVRVNSLGGLMHFREERAPEGAGTRCLVDCAIESECPYSAKKIYVDQGLWNQYVWKELESVTFKPTIDQKLDSLRRSGNPYGRCVWRCDNDVVDHQAVTVEFADGSTAVHSLLGGTAKPCRTIHVLGTKGEIVGVMEDGYFVVRHADPRVDHGYKEERFSFDEKHEMHGGGDLLLVEDFVRVVKGEAPSISTTSLEDSVNGHLIGFRADCAREQGLSLDIPRLVQ